MEDATYTFKFGIRGRTVQEDHITVRQVPYSELLDRYDAADEWVMANPEKRYAEVYGPGMRTRVVTPSTREYILEQLPYQMPKKKMVIGLLWMDLSDHCDSVRDYRLYKLWKEGVVLPDVLDRPMTEYGYSEVDVDDWDKAFEWAHVHRWQDYGIWINQKPALMFTPNYPEAEIACQRCVQMLHYLSTKKLVRAPVRYDWQQRELPYPRMAPTRSAPAIQKLRHKYPTAGEDLLVAPLEYLIWKYGYSLAR